MLRKTMIIFATAAAGRVSSFVLRMHAPHFSCRLLWP